MVTCTCYFQLKSSFLIQSNESGSVSKEGRQLKSPLLSQSYEIGLVSEEGQQLKSSLLFESNEMGAISEAIGRQLKSSLLLQSNAVGAVLEEIGRQLKSFLLLQCNEMGATSEEIGLQLQSFVLLQSNEIGAISEEIGRQVGSPALAKFDRQASANVYASFSGFVAEIVVLYLKAWWYIKASALFAKKTVYIDVENFDGLIQLSRELIELGYSLYSPEGRTLNFLTGNGIPVRSVMDLKQPVNAFRPSQFYSFSIVVVNFEKQVVLEPGLIVRLVCGATKANSLVVVDPLDYPIVLEALRKSQRISMGLNIDLTTKALNSIPSVVYSEPAVYTTELDMFRQALTDVTMESDILFALLSTKAAALQAKVRDFFPWKTVPRTKTAYIDVEAAHYSSEDFERLAQLARGLIKCGYTLYCPSPSINPEIYKFFKENDIAFSMCGDYKFVTIFYRMYGFKDIYILGYDMLFTYYPREIGRLVSAAVLANRLVVVDQADYERVIEAFSASPSDRMALYSELSKKAMEAFHSQ